MKNVTLPRVFLLPALLRTAVNETVCWSQTNAAGPRSAAAQGPGAQERARRARWHFWCKHVACWRAKNLVGGLYLFSKEPVRFIYTRRCLHVLIEWETQSLSAQPREPRCPGTQQENPSCLPGTSLAGSSEPEKHCLSF